MIIDQPTCVPGFQRTQKTIYTVLYTTSNVPRSGSVPKSAPRLYADRTTVQYSTVQYSTVQYSTVQYSTVQYSTVQYSTVQYSAGQHNKPYAVMHLIARHSITKKRNACHCITLYHMCTFVNSCKIGSTTWKSSIWPLRVLYALYSLRRAGSFLQRPENASILSFMSPEGALAGVVQSVHRLGGMRGSGVMCGE